MSFCKHITANPLQGGGRSPPVRLQNLEGSSDRQVPVVRRRYRNFPFSDLGNSRMSSLQVNSARLENVPSSLPPLLLLLLLFVFFLKRTRWRSVKYLGFVGKKHANEPEAFQRNKKYFPTSFDFGFKRVRLCLTQKWRIVRIPDFQRWK